MFYHNTRKAVVKKERSRDALETGEKERAMLAAERRQYILEVLARQGRVLAPTLSDELHVSEDTIRRDLNELAAEGKLLRVHGGALPVSPAATTYAVRQRSVSPAKMAIAQQAATLIRDGQVVLIGGGTTNEQLARHLPLQLHATVITHNPPVAVVLAEHPHIEVVLLGGRLLKRTMVTVGAQTVDAVRMVRADICFLGVCSLHPELGISIPDLDEAYVQRAMIASASEVIALASREKLNTAASHIVGPLSEITQLITNRDIPDEMLQAYSATGMTIMKV